MVKRARLGEGGKPPIEKAKESALRHVLVGVAMLIAAVVIFIGGDLAINVMNGLFSQMGGEVAIVPGSTLAWGAKGFVFFIVAVVFTRKM